MPEEIERMRRHSDGGGQVEALELAGEAACGPTSIQVRASCVCA